MAARIEALGQATEARLAGLTGRTLDTDVDGPLQTAVAAAAKELATPIALVSLVLRRTQFFRASVGLPTDLATSRATDRDVSFCQFVVRDGQAFEVQDARADPRVPKELVDRYGIQAYLGEPIRVGSAVVGSLCVIDTTPRAFTAHERAFLRAGAATVSARLEQLAGPALSVGALTRGTTPLFAELRNVLAPLQANVVHARISATELGPLARLAQLKEGELLGAPVLGVLRKAGAALADLNETLADLDGLVERMKTNVAALQSVMTGGRARCTVAEVIESASTLAHHVTKLVGGVRWPPLPALVSLASSRLFAACALSTALSAMTAKLQDASSSGPIQAVFRTDAQHFEICLSGAPAQAIAAAAVDVTTLLGEVDALSVRADAEALVLAFAIA